MNPYVRERIHRKLETLSDERLYQVLDYVEFLESKFAERATPTGIFAKITETVEDTMRAGKLPIQAISGTMGVMESAAKVMKGFAAAGKTVVDEAMRASEGEPPAKPPAAPAGAVEVRHAQPAVGRDRRSARRDVAERAPSRRQRRHRRMSVPTGLFRPRALSRRTA